MRSRWSAWPGVRGSRSGPALWASIPVMALDDTVPIKPLDPNYKPAAKDGSEAKKAETVADTVPLKPLDPNYKPPAKEAPKKAETPVAPVKPAPAAKVPPLAPKTEPLPRIE